MPKLNVKSAALSHFSYFRLFSVSLNRLINKRFAEFLKSSDNDLVTVRISAFCSAIPSNKLVEY